MCWVSKVVMELMGAFCIKGPLPPISIASSWNVFVLSLRY